MWTYNYTNELYHHGVKGMRWGHRKKYLTSTGELNSLGKARKNYEEAKSNRKNVVKEERKKVGFKTYGIKGIQNVQNAQRNINKASANEVSEKAKYNAAKSKNASKAEFKTYRKEMARSGLPGSVGDAQYGGRSTAIYNKIRVEKGKKYADRVAKSVQNETYAAIAASATVAVGMAAVSAWLAAKE